MISAYKLNETLEMSPDHTDHLNHTNHPKLDVQLLVIAITLLGKSNLPERLIAHDHGRQMARLVISAYENA